MAKKKLFTGDFEIHASVKMLYPYIESASGLSEWFADNVTINNIDKTLSFHWDNEEHRAREVARRTNHFVKFEFLGDDGEKSDLAYVELRLEFNEMTQSVYLKVTDYSEFDDAQEMQELWEGLIENLRNVVGG